MRITFIKLQMIQYASLTKNVGLYEIEKLVSVKFVLSCGKFFSKTHFTWRSKRFTVRILKILKHKPVPGLLR